MVQAGKESACNTGDKGSILGLRRSPRGGNGNPFQYSCLKKSPWTRSQSVTTEWLNRQNRQNWVQFPVLYSGSLPVIYFILFTSEVTQLCPTLCDPMDCSLPGSSVHEIFQARVLEWIAIPLTLNWPQHNPTEIFILFSSPSLYNCLRNGEIL